jgi:hypothetical protein
MFNYSKYHGSIYTFTLSKKDNARQNIFLIPGNTKVYSRQTGGEITAPISLYQEREISFRYIYDSGTLTGYFLLITILQNSVVSTSSSIIAAVAAPTPSISSIVDSEFYSASSYISNNIYYFIPESGHNNMIIIDDLDVTKIVLPTSGVIFGTDVKIMVNTINPILLECQNGDKIYNYIYSRSTDADGNITDGSTQIVLANFHMSILAYCGKWMINF